VSNLEHRLTGGNVADRVVRIGETIRKPATQATSSVEAFLNHLHDVGFTGAPAPLGAMSKAVMYSNTSLGPQWICHIPFRSQSSTESAVLSGNFITLPEALCLPFRPTGTW
jgi:hypothetical protein